MPTVQPGSFLTLHYRLSGPDGADVVNTFGGQPATLSLGSGQLAPAIEARLLGLDEGAHERFELPAGAAFGDRNPALLQRVKLALLHELGDPDASYSVGDVVPLPDARRRGRLRRRRARGRHRLAAVRLQPPARRPPGALRGPARGGAVMAEGAHLEELLLAEPRGFCAGVDRAIEIVERALIKFGAPIYVRHEIVHNSYVVADLRAKGAIFIEDLAEVPPGATLIFSAHGVQQGGAGRGGRARLPGLRRDLPARDQGPRRGRQAARARATSSS